MCWATLLKDATGNLEIVGALMDVTENTRLYRDLAEREAKIRRFVEANIIGIFVGISKGRIIEANEAFLRMVGYDREGSPLRVACAGPVLPRRTACERRTHLAEPKATGTVQPCEREYLRKDGSRVPVLMGSTLFEESGNEGLAFVLDLTERKRAERAARLGAEALRRSEAYLAEAEGLSHTGDGRFRTKGRLSIGQRRVIEFLGLIRVPNLPSREGVWQAVHPDDRERAVRGGPARQCARREDYKVEFRIYTPWNHQVPRR